MKTFSGLILTKVLGWKMKGEFPDISRSIVIFAPHTSYCDALYGKLYANELGINHRFLSKKELFFFPMSYLMKMYGAIPVRGIAGKNAIFEVVRMLNETSSLHIVISPEGRFAKVTKWDRGFYYMALKADVPIVVVYIDYQKKEIGTKGVIYDLNDEEAVTSQINSMFKDVAAKHPENFSIDMRK